MAARAASDVEADLVSKSCVLEQPGEGNPIQVKHQVSRWFVVATDGPQDAKKGSVRQLFQSLSVQTIRLIVINSNHLIGSGAWDHVFFFRCRNGHAVSDFSESYRNGVKIEKRSNTELRLVSGEWPKGDRDCCLSRQMTEIFRWDSKKSAFAMSTKSSRRRS